MDERGGRQRRVRWVLVALAGVLLVGAASAAWVLTRPATSRFCTAAGVIDDEGAATADEARALFAAGTDLALDLERPDERTASDDREVFVFLLEGREAGVVEAGRTPYRELVTERGDDGRWRVTSANRCERWTS